MGTDCAKAGATLPARTARVTSAFAIVLVLVFIVFPFHFFVMFSASFFVAVDD
jgi:hypothetical protein